VKTAKITAKTGTIVKAMVVGAKEERDLMAISGNGQVIRLMFRAIPLLGRDTQGVRIMRFKAEGDSVASVTLV
jgi:DNA gyrase subunit A